MLDDMQVFKYEQHLTTQTMKCEISGKKIPVTFLNKPEGTCIKDEKGKKHWVSAEAQRQFKTKKELLDNLK